MRRRGSPPNSLIEDTIMSAAIDLELFARTRAAVNEDPSFRKLGTADMMAGIRLGDTAFIVQFEAFECAGVEQVDVEQLRDADFYLELPAPALQHYLAGRKAGTAPSLSSLDLDTEGGIVRGTDPLRTLKFERYLGTLQAFFDKSANLA
jgi:hypothetical protein